MGCGPGVGLVSGLIWLVRDVAEGLRFGTRQTIHVDVLSHIHRLTEATHRFPRDGFGDG